ncbi:glycosyltransferase [Thiomicrospira pelophila]|uniref:glycosyltransferase n=1 Tax=Thiomicrospira pelophila TaxID=934 RepID=UPI00068985AC|nr:glycosyltransferase [Thiomicrospira pelophila]
MSEHEPIKKVETISMLKVSVIIPTYKDWNRVAVCLDALSRQTFPENDFEVIVVNNNPKDNNPKMDLSPNVMVIEEAQPGSYAARNTGISHASGDVLVFTDADCIPDVNWLTEGLQVIEKGADRVAGHIILEQSPKNKQTVAEIYSKAFVFDQFKRVKKGVAVTANLFVKKELFEKVGLFNEQLMSGGDFEWNERATKLGCNIVYAPSAKVTHPSLKTIRELLKKERRIAGGVITLKKMRGEGISFFSLIRNLLPPVKVLFRLLKRKDLTAYEAVLAFSIHYFLNGYKQYSKFLIYSGLRGVTRC